MVAQHERKKGKKGYRTQTKKDPKQELDARTTQNTTMAPASETLHHPKAMPVASAWITRERAADRASKTKNRVVPSQPGASLCQNV